MKKFLSFCLILCAAAGLAFARGRGETKPLLGVITPAADHGFTAESIRHGEAQVKALAAQYGFDYRYLTALESGEQ
ncbi:MAG: sugar ABC transporter substrate-binding protein, partial [Treponema sp.]|nr:sugar ABC transporter substrate-binding protein [Treponema sp.]